MPRRSLPLVPVLSRLRRPLTLTWAGMIAERVVHAFWPFWTVLAALAAFLMMGLQDGLPVEVVWAIVMLSGLGMIVFALQGVRKFRWPGRQEAIDRLDSVLPGHPLAALADEQAIGGGDPGSEALWKAHLERMAQRAAKAHTVEPNLRLSRKDPFGLRYIALLGLVVSLLFGSVWRVGSVTQIGPQGAMELANGPTWEGWIEPPFYTNLPSLYLSDLEAEISVPVGSRITLRLYGEVGALSVAETVSGRTENVGAASDPEQGFDIQNDGMLRIDGPGGREWSIVAIPDLVPTVELADDGARTTFDGLMSRPFTAADDYGVRAGTATFQLDLDRVTRRYGLEADPEPRTAIELDLPMPIAGGRTAFSETLVENLSQHPWAHLPVSLELEVQDASDQTGASVPKFMPLPARRFFDPLAAAVIEQRRDLLWTRDNARRVSQILRAVSHNPEPGLFRSDTTYLKFRVILRRLESLSDQDDLTVEARDEISLALWDLAILLEDGDIGDALERMRNAQERLSEAMKNGASDEEVAQLMQELRDATQDYLRQKSQQAQRDGEQNGDQQSAENRMQMTQQDLQDMMDRIQDLMEQGRFAEAQQALEEFQEMMENLRVTEGQEGEGDSAGQQAMEGLADTLRNQQGLSDQAFRDLQEQFNSDAQSGQSQGNEGQSGGLGRGQSHDGQGQGQGQGDSDQQGQGGQPGGGSGSDPGALAEQQEALRRELERQRGNLPGAGSEAGQSARDALDRAGRAMEGAEDALRGNDLAGAIDNQAQAMEALREGMQNLGDALAENNQTPGGQGQARGQFGDQQSDPLGRTLGRGAQGGDSSDNLLQGEDVYRRARELLDEIRRRYSDDGRSDVERDYLERLLNRF